MTKEITFDNYKPTWFIGDRVSGKWNKIPFIGTVGNDSIVSEEEGPKVSIFVDLPIKFKDKVHNIIFVKPKEIKALIKLDDKNETARKNKRNR